MRRRRIASTLVLVALLAALGATVGNRIRTSSPMLPPPLRRVIEPTAETLAGSELREVRGRRRLPPDARFVRAAEILVELFTGERSASAEVRDEGTFWVLRLDSRQALRVPDLADFGPLADALGALARELASEGDPAPGGPVAIEPGSPLALIGQLQQLESGWRGGAVPAGELPAAARLLVRLTARTHDTTGMAEEIAARALAALAAARALSSQEPLTAEEALLAYDLGYTAHALRQARDLGPDHPVRAFVEHDHERLARIATAEGADALARHLWLRRVSFRSREEWVAAFEAGGFSAGDLAALASGLDLTGEDPLHVARSLVAGLAERAGVDLSSDDLLPRVEGALDDPKGEARGALGWNLASIHHRALLLSALRRAATVELDWRGAPARARPLLADLPAEAPGSLGELRRWLSARLAWVERRNPAEALAVLASSRLAPDAVIDLAFEIGGDQSYSEWERLDSARRIAARLDARPWHRWLLAQLARTQLFDLMAAEAFYASAAEADPQKIPLAQLYLASLREDPEALLRIAEDEAVANHVRVRALHLLDDPDPLQDARARRVFGERVRSEPSNFDRAARYAEYLAERGEHAASAAVMEGWLGQADPRAKDLRWVQAVVLLARSHREAGDPERAWRTLEPIRDSWKESALQETARVLEARGLIDEAVATARRSLQRYPRSAGGVALLAELLWRSGDDESAAELLAGEGESVLSEWRLPRLGEAFARVFADLPPERAERAARLLKKMQVRPELLPRFGSELAERDRPEAAFRVASLVRRRGVPGAQLRTRAYRILRAWRGAEAADEWIVRETPPEDRLQASWVAYHEEFFHLVWDLVPEPPSDKHGDFVWVLRAAAALREDPGPERLEQLGIHFAREFEGNGRRWYGLLGRMLLGLASEEEAFAAATSPRRRCELYYYLAEKARAEGRYSDLLDGYLAAVETEQRKTGEFNWALGRLYLWSNSETTVSRLAAERA